jgi:SpoVK/Ycf46/Vps4 family AAA+-type ATPase
MISPAIAAIALGVALLVAFAGGFAVSDLRSGAEIERLKSDSKLLTAANNKCSADIQSVRNSMEAMASVSVERERQAQEGMREVEPIVEKIKAKIIKIRSLPAVAPDKQCEAIITEQIAYVQARRDD